MPKQIHKLSIIGTHNFRKINAVTQMDDYGQYDLMKCTDCGIEGKCRDMRTVDVNRMTKKATYCTLSNAEIKKREESAEYNSGTKTKHKCPNCKNTLSEIALYNEEDTNNILAQMVCVCGHKEFINATERENKKRKKTASKRLRQLFEERRKIL